MNFEDIDDSEFIEIIKFDDPIDGESILFDDVFTVYIQPDWNSLEEFVNLWNKKRHRIKCNKIKVYPKGIKVAPEVDKNITYHLDIGKRLLKALKEKSKDKPKYIKILRVGKGFDTIYYVEEYKFPASQTKTTPKKQTKKSS